jgi:hypothetical protein
MNFGAERVRNRGTVTTGFDGLLTSPSSKQAMLLGLVASIYLDNAEWPRWGWLEEELDNAGINGLNILENMPRESTHNYGWTWPSRQSAPMPTDRIGLTVAGLMKVERAGPLVDLFANFLNALGVARRKVSLDPLTDGDPSVRRQLVLGGRLPSPVWQSRVFGLLSKEPSTWHCVFDPNSADWQSVNLPPVVRRYSNISSADDYMNVLENQLVPPTQASAPYFDVGIGPRNALTETPPKTSGKYVFVIMPFTEPWSDDVYEHIKKVGAKIETQPLYVMQRADEITESGRITDQIESALKRADVVIADITGIGPISSSHPNPNVMWELGFAHALGKNVVIINQDRTAAPFDVSVHRQVRYSMPPTEDDEEMLLRHLRTALGAD